LNIFEFAKMLDGRKHNNEISKDEEKKAKELGFVVVFGYSDDNMEFRGAIDDEVGCYDGGNAYITKYGILEDCKCECEHYQRAKDNSTIIKALWCNEDNYSWTYETTIPHATFDILEDDEKYCRGIVFDIEPL
jgi:hypothetical protein